MKEIQGRFFEVAGKFYKDKAEAQKLELIAIIPETWPTSTGILTDKMAREIMADWLLANAEAVTQILTGTTEARKRKQRKDKGVPRGKRDTSEANP